jgi:gamma-glutamyl hercynylcysteine S-oxide hydrolase
MCRHLAYLGPATSLRELLIDPPHSLYRQSWAPRHQRYGTVNADGFGAGWYAPGDPVPARYRRAVPIWSDPSFADVARVTRSGAVLAAVRSATEGTAPGEASAAPYAADRWLFSHNGALPGWPATLAAAASSLAPEDLLGLEARCDSALVWALVLKELRAGVPSGDALAAAVRRVATGRLNLLLTDGATIAATTWGDTLFHLHRPGHCVLVASEPTDDDPRWEPVPDRTLLLATPESVRLTPLTPGDPAASAATAGPPATAATGASAGTGAAAVRGASAGTGVAATGAAARSATAASDAATVATTTAAASAATPGVSVPATVASDAATSATATTATSDAATAATAASDAATAATGAAVSAPATAASVPAASEAGTSATTTAATPATAASDAATGTSATSAPAASVPATATSDAAIAAASATATTATSDAATAATAPPLPERTSCS